MKKLLDALRPEIHGMVHCSGGAQTKVLHFVGHVRVVKDNLFLYLHCSEPFRNKAVPTGLKCIRYSTWDTASKVYLSPEHTAEVIAISGVLRYPAQIVGRIEESDKKSELIIKSEFKVNSDINV